jgi:hypothetical protein
MNRPSGSFAIFSLAAVLLATASNPLRAADDAAAAKRFLATYCNDCHGAKKQSADRRFDALVLPVRKADGLIDLKDILDQIHLGEMPPKKAPQPTKAERQAFVEQTTRLLTAGREKLASTGGSTVLRRLNRREYLNTVGDLFALNMASFDPTTKFPLDQTEGQMDNLGDVLRTSGYLLEQYLDAADAVVEKAFALEKPVAERSWHFREPLNVWECMDTENHEGGYAVIKDFKAGVPADGYYEIQVLAHAANRKHQYDPAIFGIDSREPFLLGVVPGTAKLGPLDAPQSVQPLLAEHVLADGQPEWYTKKVWLDAGQTPRFVFPNGPKNFRKTWFTIARMHPDKWSADAKEKGKLTNIGEAHKITVAHGQVPHISILEVKLRGPILDSWPPASQRAVVGKDGFDPKRTRELLVSFAGRAYRRPATKDEIDRLVAVAEKRVKAGHTPLVGFKAALKTALCSPSFLYLSQDVVADKADPKTRPRLSAHALASRLSYFLWSTTPDAELLRLADNGELTKPELLVAQTRRMIASPRSDAFVASFLDSWLNLRSLGTTPPDRKEFDRYYSKGLEHAFKVETRMFMRDLLDRDASIVNFLDSKHTFVNQALATHYGLGDLGDPARAHEFRKVTLTNPNRGGLLGMGSVLTVTANGIETSPVVRGVFVLEHILGTPPPPPPDDVPAIDPDVRGAKSVRDLLSKHRESPNCFACHRKIDPPGFALENFDPIGGWRSKYDKKTPVDASGELPGGQKFTDIAGLKKILVEQRTDQFSRMLTARLLSYACGRRIEGVDQPTVEKIAAGLPDRQYALRSLVEAVVLSDRFLSR